MALSFGVPEPDLDQARDAKGSGRGNGVICDAGHASRPLFVEKELCNDENTEDGMSPHKKLLKNIGVLWLVFFSFQ